MRSHIERMTTLSDEVRYNVLKYLADNPQASQRDVALHLGISIGKVNYCIQALVHLGWIKVQNFKNSRRKSAYLYLLTPDGVEQKVSITLRFLQRKLAEYDRLVHQIQELRAEVASALPDDAPEASESGSVRPESPDFIAAPGLPVRGAETNR